MTIAQVEKLSIAFFPYMEPVGSDEPIRTPTEKKEATSEIHNNPSRHVGHPLYLCLD